MPYSRAIHPPISRVVRGSVISDQRRQPRQLLRRQSANTSFVAETRQALDPDPLSYSRCQVRIVSSSRYSTFTTTSQLMPSSNSSSALARRAKRCAAEPSRVSSIRSCPAIRYPGSPVGSFGQQNPDLHALASDLFGFPETWVNSKKCDALTKDPWTPRRYSLYKCGRIILTERRVRRPPFRRKARHEEGEFE